MDYRVLWGAVGVAVCVLLGLKASKSEQKVKNVCDEGNTSADTAGSNSSTSAPVSGGEYEVFLSFRGEDTRKTFTDHLYHDLVEVGIRTFRDNEELRVGEEIRPALPKAIKESTISIPIFSKGYASSKWCLRELAKMVECHKTMGHKILPIFLDVEPSDVRHQTGTYEQAFRQHLKYFDKKTVQGWKEAMREVGEMKGWELKKETNGCCRMVFRSSSIEDCRVVNLDKVVNFHMKQHCWSTFERMRRIGGSESYFPSCNAQTKGWQQVENTTNIYDIYRRIHPNIFTLNDA